MGSENLQRAKQQHAGWKGGCFALPPSQTQTNISPTRGWAFSNLRVTYITRWAAPTGTNPSIWDGNVRAMVSGS